MNVRRVVLTLIIVLSILLILVSCGWHGSGTVIERKYHRAYTTVTSQCTKVNNISTCHPVTQYHPEWWELKVRDSVDSKTHWVDVSENEYNNIAIGDTFTNGES